MVLTASLNFDSHAWLCDAEREEQRIAATGILRKTERAVEHRVMSSLRQHKRSVGTLMPSLLLSISGVATILGNVTFVGHGANRSRSMTNSHDAMRKPVAWEQRDTWKRLDARDLAREKHLRGAAVRMTATEDSTAASGKPRVVFLGSPACVNTVLSTMVDASRRSENGFDISAIVTQPPKMAGKNKNRRLAKTPIHELSEELGIETIMIPESARDAEFLDQLEALQPDLCITAAYGQYLPKRFLEAPKLGTLNLHPSLLPLWRGASPVQRSLQAGDSETGITILYTVKKMDAGPIALQRTIDLLGNETSEDLLNSLFKWGAELLVDEVLPKVFSGELTMDTAQQQEEDAATKAPMIAKEEGRLWPHNETAFTMRDKIRGFVGWPGTTLPIACSGSEAAPQGFRAKVFGVEVVSASTLPPEDLERPCEELAFLVGRDGRNHTIAVRPATDPDHVLLLDTLHLPGKSQVDAKTFKKGYMKYQPAKWTYPEEEQRLAEEAAAPKKKKAKKS